MISYNLTSYRSILKCIFLMHLAVGIFILNVCWHGLCFIIAEISVIDSLSHACTRTFMISQELPHQVSTSHLTSFDWKSERIKDR